MIGRHSITNKQHGQRSVDQIALMIRHGPLLQSLQFLSIQKGGIEMHLVQI